LLHFVATNIFGNFRAATVYYQHTNKRRVRGEFYENDHFFYKEIGAKGWTDKKNKIGWSKTDADELRIGWNDVVIVTKIPDYYAQSVQSMNTLLETKPEYFTFPGSSYSVNSKTFVIPGLDDTSFRRQLNKGAKELFTWLKTMHSLSTTQTEFDRLNAFMVVTRTHIYQVVKDDKKSMPNEDYYCRVFASQSRGGIKLTGNSFNGNIPSVVANLIIGIVNGTKDKVWPTLVCGNIYVTARFGTEWQGMRIRKQYKSPI
jgi:hypothetical protein